MKITLYIKQGSSIIKWRKFLNKEIAQARNIKTKATKDSVIASLRAIRSLFSKEHKKKGAVFFAEDGKVQVEFPPEPFTFSSYYCGNEFNEEALLGVIDDSKGPYKGIIVIDANEAAIGIGRGDTTHGLWHGYSNVMGKHDAGGQSQRRFQRGRDEALKQWRRKVIGVAQVLWGNYGGIENVILGGPGFEKNRLRKDKYFLWDFKMVNSEYCDDVYGVREAWLKSNATFK